MTINIPTLVSQTITNGVTAYAPSENVVYDALALKLDTSAFSDTGVTSKLLTGGVFPSGAISDTNTILEAFETIDSALSGTLDSALSSAKIFVGNSSNFATARTLTLSATPATFALSNTGVLSMPDATTSLRGLLTPTDWNTFNGKQATLVNQTNLKSVDGTTLLGSGNLAIAREIQLACSDETTALTTGTAKITFRMPRAGTVTGVRASLSTAQTGGSIFTVDINEAGTSILSTKLTIDNGEKTSTTAVTAPVISDSAIADDAEMTIDIDQVGDGTAKGLKVTIYYTI